MTIEEILLRALGVVFYMGVIVVMAICIWECQKDKELEKKEK
jgi:hypothetical protein